MCVAGLLCLHFVPDVWVRLGVPGVLVMLAGLGFPMLLEAVFSRAVHSAHLAVIFIAALGVVAHALLDGIALLPTEGGGVFANELALGVILHRLPVGMVIWWAVRPQFGTLAAVATLALIIGVTAVSYFLGADLLNASAGSLLIFQAFVAGSLLHIAVVGMSHEHDHPEGSEPRSGSRMSSRAFRAGLLLGVLVVFVLPDAHGSPV